MTIDKLEKKEKQVNNVDTQKESEKPVGRWLQLVLPKINAVPAAQRAWKVLVKAGFDLQDQEEVAEYLFGYSGGTNDQLKRGAERARRFRDEFEPVIAQLRATAGAVERMIKDLRDIGHTTIHSQRFDALPSILKEFANNLDELRPVFKKIVAKGVKIEKDGRVTGGRSEQLSVLVSVVSRIKKVEAEPYAFLAPMVTAVRGDAEPNYVYVADELRNAVNRYRRASWPKKYKRKRSLTLKTRTQKTSKTT